MRAVEMQQSIVALAVTEQDQILAEAAHTERQIRHHRGQCDRVPEAAQIFAARSAGTNLGQLPIGLEGEQFIAVMPTEISIRGDGELLDWFVGHRLLADECGWRDNAIRKRATQLADAVR